MQSLVYVGLAEQYYCRSGSHNFHIMSWCIADNKKEDSAGDQKVQNKADLLTKINHDLETSPYRETNTNARNITI